MRDFKTAQELFDDAYANLKAAVLAKSSHDDQGVVMTPKRQRQIDERRKNMRLFAIKGKVEREMGEQEASA